MPRRPDRKHQGDVSELAFMHKAVELGFEVARPWGENNRYDFIVDSEGRLTRVQVKSAAVAHGGGYRVNSGSGQSSKQPYTRAQIDLLAAYILPEDLWYLIPVSAFAPRKTIRLYPGQVRHRWERFREAWHRLKAQGSRRTAQDARLKAQGSRRTAQGTRLKAQGGWLSGSRKQPRPRAAAAPKVSAK